VPSSVDTLEHGAAITDDQIKIMVQQGTWRVPTFAVYRKVLVIERDSPGLLPEYIK
jgi:hypothetical protein